MLCCISVVKLGRVQDCALLYFSGEVGTSAGLCWVVFQW